MLICLATSERPPISDFLFRVGRELESVGPAKLFDRFGGIFPGKTWGKHLLQRPPTGAKFRQLRLFPYHLKSAGSDTVPVRVRSAAPRRRSLRTAQKTRFRKSRVFFDCAPGLLLLSAGLLQHGLGPLLVAPHGQVGGTAGALSLSVLVVVTQDDVIVSVAP